MSSRQDVHGMFSRQSKILILFFVDTHETIFTDLFADHWIRDYVKVWQQSLELGET